jgi:hypothetical protein
VDTEFDSRLALKTTDDLTEGTTNLYYTDIRVDSWATGVSSDIFTEGTANLYYTDARVDTWFTAQNTDDLFEGTANLYYTDARVDTWLALQNTDDLTEGTVNLYYTGARVDTWLTLQTTDGLAEGTLNLYYTDARVDTEFDTRLALKTTDDLSEGTTNLYFSGKTTDALSEGTVNIYFTDGRARSAVVVDSIADGDTTHAPSRNAVYDALSALGGSSTFQSYTNMEASPITIRQFVYQSAAGQVLLLRADASLANDYVVFGSVKDASIGASGSGNVFLPHMGVRIGGFTGLDISKPLYASRTTAGLYVQTLTGFVTGDYVILLGQPISSTEIIFIGQVEFQF